LRSYATNAKRLEEVGRRLDGINPNAKPAPIPEWQNESRL
jgi:hypothetical protein